MTIETTPEQATFARDMAHDIALQPGIYRHWIGNDDAILGRDGPTGFRMQDFIPEAELATYRAYVYGSPEATE